MSHSSHANVPPSTSGVEEDFIDFKGVYGFGIGLAVVTIIAHILMLWMFKAEVARRGSTRLRCSRTIGSRPNRACSRIPSRTSRICTPPKQRSSAATAGSIATTRWSESRWRIRCG